MAKTKDTITIEGRPYKIEDTRRTLMERVRPEKSRPGLKLAPSRETKIVPQPHKRLRKPRQEIIFHGGRSDASMPRSYKPVVSPMTREQTRAEYQDRALKYGATGLAASIPIRAAAESRGDVRPAVEAWNKARGRAIGVTLGRLSGGDPGRRGQLTPKQFAETVRQNAGTLGRVPDKHRMKVVHALGPGDYSKHIKVLGFRNALRLGLPLAGASAAGLQYLYDRNRKHYRIDYRRPE